MKRRTFLGVTGATLTGTAAASEAEPQAAESSPNPMKEPLMNEIDLSAIPIACSHEHWGSVDAIGVLPEGFRADVECGARPRRGATVFDLLLDPYLHGMLAAAGDDPGKVKRPAGIADAHAWMQAAPDEAFEAMRPLFRRHELTGTYQCIRRGIERLYGIDIAADNFAGVVSLNEAIRANYARLFNWYAEAMERARFSMLIRPVHPEFYVRESDSAAAQKERRFTDTVMRIDPLLGLWQEHSPRREGLAKITGVDPRDAASWREFLAKIFTIAEQYGAKGIKQLQAYSRPLEFAPRNDADVVWRGDLNPDQVRAFQDWVVHECCSLANDRDWPHQVHVGTHNLAQSSPMPLAALAQKYPRIRIVMLHCWPFLKEAGWLAKHHANVYIDTCWQPVLNPAFYYEAMSGWLGFVPTSKIMCGQDATSVEMAVGSSLFVRELLARVLQEQTKPLGWTAAKIERAATDILNNNAVAIYRIGKAI